MASADIYRFRLYVAGTTPNSAQAFSNLKELCRKHLAERHEIEIVDIFKDPERALLDGIMLTPTLLKLTPLPEQKLVGTLGDTRLVVQALGIQDAAKNA